MTPSRTESRRRLPGMTLSRWLAAFVTLVVLAVLGVVLYVRSADAGYRGEERNAVRLAESQAGLTEIESAVSYTWNETLWVVLGKDRDGVEWFVWEREGGIEKMKLSDGYSEARIRERFAIDRPSARVIRILPGWAFDQPIWEIRYKKAPRADQQSIDFYSFRDGTLLKTYDLPGS
ncbi:DUF5590 domain-containing protein [Cohnella caldifontis]|uniref:cell wall elongation regulator TseB-like domain-containing protein n=1 Tax=Cohnella caldifontis TaxID=3027471 RepID=UPI0023EB569D|nr:DUF5590 domain-containing protein [Cohnella sp. YIM B05605]